MTFLPNFFYLCGCYSNTVLSSIYPWARSRMIKINKPRIGTWYMNHTTHLERHFQKKWLMGWFAFSPSTTALISSSFLYINIHKLFNFHSLTQHHSKNAHDLLLSFFLSCTLYCSSCDCNLSFIHFLGWFMFAYS